MRIGLIVQLHGSPGGSPPAPTWESIHRLAATAEVVGFDSFVFEDALLYRGSEVTDGVWESVAVAGAVAAVTSRIEFGQSVINAPYRSPALTAKIAETLDEISGGRYILGIGAGNTADSDYEAFGFPTDRRFSRFAEAIEIIHGLLKGGKVDFEGAFHSARASELVLRGPRPQGPPIVIAAGGPKMLRLAARYGDAWNWWTADLATAEETLGPIVAELNGACEEVGRDPSTLRRTVDVYSVDPSGGGGEAIGKLLTGTTAVIAETLLGLGVLGFDEVRCDVVPNTAAAVEAMADVVSRVQAG